MKKRKITAALAALFTAATISTAATAAVFEPGRVTYDTGKIAQNNGNDLALFVISPELVHGSVSAVFDINVMFDRKFKMRDSGNDIVVLDSVKLDRGEKLRARYGDIEGLTLGRGFLVSNYYSNTMNNVGTNEQKGLVVETANEMSRIKVFGTLSHVMGGRAERKLGRATVGATLVTDSDPKFTAYGLDAKFKVVPERWSAYFETADINHAGNGFCIGSAVTLEPEMDLTLTGEYRKFDSDFAPGMVNEHYEAKPVISTISNSPTGKVDGFVWAADYKRDERFGLKAFYEDYEGVRPRVGLGLKLKPVKRAALDLYYAQENFVQSGNMRREDSVILGTLNIGVTPRVDFIVDYYRAFDDAKNPLESLGTKVKYHKKR